MSESNIAAASEIQPKSGVNKIVPWLLSLLWMLLIFLLSNQPNSGELTKHIFGTWNVVFRKAAHISEYTVLYCLYHWSILSSARGHNGHAINYSRHLLYAGCALIMCVLYAMSDEWHQSFVPGRTATIYDVMVDSIGALIGWLCCSIRSMLQPVRSTASS